MTPVSAKRWQCDVINHACPEGILFNEDVCVHGITRSHFTRTLSALWKNRRLCVPARASREWFYYLFVGFRHRLRGTKEGGTKVQQDTPANQFLSFVFRLWNELLVCQNKRTGFYRTVWQLFWILIFQRHNINKNRFTVNTQLVSRLKNH